MKLKGWANLAEITASVAVVVSLIILIVQMKESNDIERAQSLFRVAYWDAQLFIMSEELPQAMAKIKAVDGNDMQMYMDRYDLSYEQAATLPEPGGRLHPEGTDRGAVPDGPHLDAIPGSANIHRRFHPDRSTHIQ